MTLNLEKPIPKEIVAFREEIKLHPELYKELKSLGSFSEIISRAAVRAGLNIHGAFSEQEMLIIIGRIVDLLQKKRQIIIMR